MTSWVLNTIALLAITVGTLFIFLHLHRTNKQMSAQVLHEDCAPLLRDRRVLLISSGLLAAWFVVQYLAVILI